MAPALCRQLHATAFEHQHPGPPLVPAGCHRPLLHLLHQPDGPCALQAGRQSARHMDTPTQTNSSQGKFISLHTNTWGAAPPAAPTQLKLDPHIHTHGPPLPLSHKHTPVPARHRARGGTHS
eukprot:1160066-Pelagomonas_calceolata.AAC.6